MWRRLTKLHAVVFGLLLTNAVTLYCNIHSVRLLGGGILGSRMTRTRSGLPSLHNLSQSLGLGVQQHAIVERQAAAAAAVAPAGMTALNITASASSRTSSIAHDTNTSIVSMEGNQNVNKAAAETSAAVDSNEAPALKQQPQQPAIATHFESNSVADSDATEAAEVASPSSSSSSSSSGTTDIDANAGTHLQSDSNHHLPEQVRQKLTSAPSKLPTVTPSTTPSTMPTSTKPVITAVHQDSIKNNAPLDHELYKRVYNSYQINRKKSTVSTTTSNDSHQNISTRRSLATYGEQVLQSQCDITVLIMDPRIPSETMIGSTASFALESIAKYLPQACVVIKTSKCNVEKRAQQQHVPHHPHAGAQSNERSGANDDSTRTKDIDVESIISQMLYDMSLPLFKQMIDRGQVRVSFLDHAKYQLRSCHNFFNPSAAFMNIHFWGDDEYVPNVDSDTVLVMQDDSVLCHGFDVDAYRKYAMVGGVWHPYACSMLAQHWKMYMTPQREANLRGSGGAAGSGSTLPLPSGDAFPNICSNRNGIGPLGNGGFSLRSRRAMRKVIETCPHKRWSGINVSGRNLPCVVNVENSESNKYAMQEDVYFGTVLRATGATLPTAFVASLFAVEMSWPDQTIDSYGGPAEATQRERLAKEASCTYHGAKGVRWGKANGMLRQETVPIGFHQPFEYHSQQSLLSDDLRNQCPFIPYMIDPLFRKS